MASRDALSKDVFVMLVRETLIVIFVGLLAVAAFSDIRERIIPNAFCLALLALWPFDLWLGTTASGASSGQALTSAMMWSGLQGLGIGLASFLVGAFLFARGGLGGGDVKLLSVVGMWAGPHLWLPFISITALAGGVLALIVVARAARTTGFRPRAWRGLTMPYGVAIACGGLYVAASLPVG